ITVGVSGGKDSLVLLVTLANLRRFYPKPFKLSAVTLDLGYGDMDYSPIAKLCEDMGVDYYIKKTDIKEIVFDIRKESNPCSLCAKMRRGALHDAALEIGSRTVALGHHNDDVIETFLLSLVFEGRVGCFSPVSYLDRKGITLIRPMIYMPERYSAGLAKRMSLPVVKNSCPADGNSKRQYIKELVSRLEAENPGFKTRAFTAIVNGNVGGFGTL
ncbi:MAG: tRNA 2-thiocytidine biosynthesis TtcA family protein, partial [Clostridia bacterium]